MRYGKSHNKQVTFDDVLEIVPRRKRRIRSNYTYYQPCKCEACYGDTNWHDVVAIQIMGKPAQDAVQIIFGRRRFMYVCPNCFRREASNRHGK